jgi:hypothetical protein
MAINQTSAQIKRIGGRGGLIGGGVTITYLPFSQYIPTFRIDDKLNTELGLIWKKKSVPELIGLSITPRMARLVAYAVALNLRLIVPIMKLI